MGIARLPMKIHWFSPLTPLPTDIAHFTKRLLPALSARAEVVLWTEQKHWYASLKHFAEIRRFDPQNIHAEQFATDQAVFYNMGNDARFHRGIWEVARRVPGFVILHDVFLHDSVAFHFRHQKDRAAYLRVMQSLYGDRGRRDAEFHWDGALSMEQMGRRYTCAPYILEESLGAIVHSCAAERALRQESDLPVSRLSLPYPAHRHPAPHDGPPPWSLVVFGYLGANRCLDQILNALASREDRSRFHLHIYGQLNHRAEVEGLIGRLQLQDTVTIHGFVHEAELEAALASAHLAINLRFPTKGEASGSQLRIWSHALPGIVSRIGWYAELPPGTAAFVRPHAIVEDLNAHLDRYTAAPELYREIGRKGYDYFVEEHSAERYAISITQLAANAAEYGAHLHANRLRARAVKALHGWLDVDYTPRLNEVVGDLTGA